MDVADACHAAGVRTVAVTAGYIGPDARRDLYAKIDAANVDLKGWSDAFYRSICGAELAQVKETLVCSSTTASTPEAAASRAARRWTESSSPTPAPGAASACA